MPTDGWLHVFPVSGVSTWFWLPPLVAFVLSLFTSMVGVSGAFLLLPFQMSVLHFVSPAVSATNLVYNLVAIPGGVYRYVREGRMLSPLVWVVVLGTLPGLVAGYAIRVWWLPDPSLFKLFVGVVLVYLGLRLFLEMPSERTTRTKEAESGTLNADSRIRVLGFTATSVVFEYRGQRHAFPVPTMFLLAIVVGLVGGVYGIGGGALIAPFCVALFHLPVHAIAGATLAATFFSSIVGVTLYSTLPAPAGIEVRPDWALGALFGVGGLAGTYAGARLQKYVSQPALKLLLGSLVTMLAAGYLTRTI